MPVRGPVLIVGPVEIAGGGPVDDHGKLLGRGAYEEVGANDHRQ